MNNIFVSYEIAQRLKNLGFNEKCFSYYSFDEYLDLGWNIGDNNSKLIKNNKEWVSAPTFEQVLEFLRTQYFINIKIEYLCSVNEVLALVGVIDFMINKYEKPDIHIQSTSLDYYEVLTETILECLNIIEKWKM